MALAALNGFTIIYGFDISAAMCIAAADSLTSIRTRYPQTKIIIDQGNAREYEVADTVGIIFLFNPFDNSIMQAFAEQVMKSLKRKPRNMKLLYANPVDKALWLEHGFKEVFHFKKMEWLEGTILHYVSK